MKYRCFGRMGWQVSEVGYGMWGMAAWTGSDDTESLASMQRAVELGCNFFDTAWAYGNGHSEALLGQIVRNNPDKRLYSATKIPPKNFSWPSRRENALQEIFSPDHIEEYVHSSLKNAGLDKFDLVQFHVWEDRFLEDDSWVNKIADLRSQGLFDAIGISLNRWEPWNGIKTVHSGLVDAVQVIYNIFDQNPEDELFPACEEMDVAVIARVPFDEGTLTGNLTLQSSWPEGDFRNSFFSPRNLEACVEHAEALRPLIPEDSTMPETALRFILGEPRVSTVIPGMRKLSHVEANIAASDAGPLPKPLHEALREHRWIRDPGEWRR